MLRYIQVVMLPLGGKGRRKGGRLSMVVAGRERKARRKEAVLYAFPNGVFWNGTEGAAKVKRADVGRRVRERSE